eukprot:s6_g15.t1
MFGSWLRDNCIIAWGLFYTDPEGAGAEDSVACISSIAKFLLMLDGPHIRFIGETGLEDPKWYNHKQNDALGYFMWARTQLAWHKKLPFNGEHLKLMGQLFDYLRVIESWADLDGGHWEEHSAVHASSIGPPLAAVKLFKKVAARDGFLPPCKTDTLDVLEKNLQAALLKILPGEITFPPELARDADAATVFLAYPLEVVDDQLGLQIMDRLKKDYKDKVGEDPTKHFTDEELKERDRLLQDGEEAQWCLFDPMVSCFYGRMYQKTQAMIALVLEVAEDEKYLKLQQLFLARSLAAITGDDCPFGPWHCAEAYYLEKDRWVPNDDTPRWTAMMGPGVKMVKKIRAPERVSTSHPADFRLNAVEVATVAASCSYQLLVGGCNRSMVQLPYLGRSDGPKLDPVSPRNFTNVIDAIGFGAPQIIAMVLCGFVWAADGAELLLLGCLTEPPRKWALEAWQRGAIVSVVFIGILLGNTVGGPLGDSTGRKTPILLWQVFAVSAVSCFAFCCGEIYSAALIWYNDPSMKELDWRWLCIMGAVPSIVGLVLAYSFLKESPAYLLENGYTEEAKELIESYKISNGAEHVS